MVAFGVADSGRLNRLLKDNAADYSRAQGFAAEYFRRPARLIL